ncbi:probable palmitoyltransferase ZDHHC24 [Orussus abietinus]|uniref:probable palmitoyltransferase ZDHHC24 n=1 Tax=Orussus abietinus TaxID=222816 RepID=UPI00062632A9|nr:probable palmitoyltransferase ZDHHC24 [Orussus abietinus]
MKLRKNILPRTLSDVCSMTFILIIVPMIYWFELWVVLPDLYQPGTRRYYFHFFLGNFIMLNIVGNFTYTVLYDTSTANIVMPTSTATAHNGWRLCATCEAIAPPRSWHCPTCDVCILKRDHHCIFTGCCIGHFNHRYFLMFLFYLFVATTYAFCFNNYFIWNKIEFQFPESIVKIVFPLAIFVFEFDNSMEQFYLMLYIVSIVGMLFSGVLCVFHFRLVFIGCVADESNKQIYTYSLGWKRNILEVFGERWYLTFLLPYVHSKVPSDGITWEISSVQNKDNNKTK